MVGFMSGPHRGSTKSRSCRRLIPSRPRFSDELVLINPVAADADATHQHAIFVERQPARELDQPVLVSHALTHETGHAELEGQLPPGILPAYDGLTVEVA